MVWEVKCIEYKFSCYCLDSVVLYINCVDGVVVEIDDEIYWLFNFVNICFLLSNGLFDVIVGVLCKVWWFDGSDNVLEEDMVMLLLVNIGW